MILNSFIWLHCEKFSAKKLVVLKRIMSCTDKRSLVEEKEFECDVGVVF